MGLALRRAGLAVLAAVAAGLSMGGCSGEFFRNQTAERTGNIQFVFINNTPYRASFSFGTWDSLDRDPPGVVALQQLRVEANTTRQGIQLPCRRNSAIGTEEFVTRVVATSADDVDNFDPDAFDVDVHFSSAPIDSDAAALPTVGLAKGVEKLLGIDYACQDTLIFTFEQDPDAAGGFRIDFSVIASGADDQ